MGIPLLLAFLVVLGVALGFCARELAERILGASDSQRVQSAQAAAYRSNAKVREKHRMRAANACRCGKKQCHDCSPLPEEVDWNA